MQKNECGIQDEFNDGQQVGLCSAFRIPRSAFSLTEILIVIALIVLILAMSLPAFNFISGSRSIEAAQNEVSAFISQARAGAVGLQEVRGVMFFIDPKTNRPNMALVHQTQTQATDPQTNYTTSPVEIAPQVFLDLVADTTFVPLPKGVRLQTLENASLASTNPNVRRTDNYIGFNDKVNRVGDGNGTQKPLYVTANGSTMKIGGVILFDGYGRLISIPYGFRCQVPISGEETTTKMGELLWGVAMNTVGASPSPDVAAPILLSTNASGSPYNGPLYSTLGLVLFEEEPFVTAGYSDADPRVDLTMGSYSSSGELGEESWIDNNATPVFIDRYNGTLVKGQ